MPSSKWASIDPNFCSISSMAACRYRGFLTKIAQDRFRPALFHSTTGKDRTGWAWAATLLLPGVSEDDALCEIAARVGWDRSTGTAYDGTVPSEEVLRTRASCSAPHGWRPGGAPKYQSCQRAM